MCIRDRKILTPDIEEYLQELVQQIAEDKGFTVHLFECGEGDHVHCFVSAPPKLSITAIVKYLKGITGRKLFERFPEIRNQLWKGELWNHSYYVETIGSVSEENIRRYIEPVSYTHLHHQAGLYIPHKARHTFLLQQFYPYRDNSGS